jgi:hypothetical protein
LIGMLLRLLLLLLQVPIKLPEVVAAISSG